MNKKSGRNQMVSFQELLRRCVFKIANQMQVGAYKLYVLVERYQNTVILYNNKIKKQIYYLFWFFNLYF